MVFLLLLAAISAADAVAGGESKEMCLLQRQTRSAKTLLAWQEPEDVSIPVSIASDAEQNQSSLVLALKLAADSQIKAPSVMNSQWPPALGSAEMGGYPEYTGELKVSGHVDIGAYPDSMGHLHLQWTLDGVDKLCNGTTKPGVKNACGLHIHTGKTCSAAKLVGGHFFPKRHPVDPWAPFTYTTNSSGRSQGSGKILIGFHLPYVMNRTFVLHDHTGSRIACGVIRHRSNATQNPHAQNKSATDLKTQRLPTVGRAGMGGYPGYAGKLKVTGHADVSAYPNSPDQLHLQWNLEGADKLCDGSAKAGVKNACGLHIHKGTNCSDAKLVGGHFFNTHEHPVDPWANFTYTADTSGKSQGSGKIAIGLDLADVMAHTLVLHDHTGARIACGLIHNKSGAVAKEKSPEEAAAEKAAAEKAAAEKAAAEKAGATADSRAEMNDYPGYSGELQVRGHVDVSTHPDSHDHLQLQWSFGGADKLCNGTRKISVKNACGLHIHNGTNCSDSKLVGGHFFNTHEHPVDPWANFTYTVEKTGKSQGIGQIMIGLDLADVVAHALVLHDHTGARISCGLINYKQPAEKSAAETRAANKAAERAEKAAAEAKGSSRKAAEAAEAAERAERAAAKSAAESAAAEKAAVERAVQEKIAARRAARQKAFEKAAAAKSNAENMPLPLVLMLGIFLMSLPGKVLIGT